MTASLPPAMRWFAAPILATPVATRRARALWSMSWSLFAVLAVLLVAASLPTFELLPRRLTSIVLVGVLVTGLHLANRRGHTASASWLLVLGLTAIVTQRAWDTGGVHAHVALFYMMIVFMAAGLLGIRGSVVVAAACIASATLLAAAELAGLLVVPVVATSSLAGAYAAALFATIVAALCPALLFHQAEEGATQDLINMFVHDMRSPLTVILARLSMFRLDIPDGTEGAEHTDVAMAEAARLNLMANNLLDISRLERTSLPIHRAPLDVSALARDVAQALAALDPTRRIDVRTRMPVVCECDRELLRRIIENLLSNALKHAPPGGHVVVDVAQGEACVHIAVEDDGPGVASTERQRIFERYSAKSIRAQYGHHSVGLGLAFCRLATAAHGGRIWVEDVQPHGSRFVVELPRG